MKKIAHSWTKTFLTLGIVIASSVLLSACQAGTPNTDTSLDQTTPENQRSGFTTLQGTVQTQGATTLLQQGTETTPLQSYSLNLSEYDGQEVTVTGQFSGDELFVTEITPTGTTQ